MYFGPHHLNVFCRPQDQTGDTAAIQVQHGRPDLLLGALRLLVRGRRPQTAEVELGLGGLHGRGFQAETKGPDQKILGQLLLHHLSFNFL